jgi:chaperonin GroEL
LWGERWIVVDIMKKNKLNRVVFQPRTYQGMLEGIDQIVNAVRPTLGPMPRMVAIARDKPHDQVPEMLDSGGVIARRIIQLPDRDVDTGAMFIRQLLWRQHERVGDGTVTTAVIFQKVYREALKFVVSGGNSMVLRGHLEIGNAIIREHLEKMTIPVLEKKIITQVAESVCFDPGLAQALGDIFDIMGVYGQIDIRSGQSREISREFVIGNVMEGGFHSSTMINDPEKLRVYLENPAIFLSDLEIKESVEILPILKASIENGYSALIVVARTISEEALGVLYAASKNPQRFLAYGVKIPGANIGQQSVYLEDLAVLTGSNLYLKVTNSNPAAVQPQDLGTARRAWADKNFLGIFAGGGNPVAIRSHVNMLRKRYDQVGDDEIRKLTLSRLGKLMGASATLYIGGSSETQIERRKELAEWAIGAVRSALLRGVLPGGGSALLACKPLLDQRAAEASCIEERVAFQVLSLAMEEPTRTILLNAGYDPDVLMSRIEFSPSCDGIDVRLGEPADMVRSGILDSAGVLMEAVWGAVSSAALALTVDTMVHRKNQKMANQP